MNVVNNAHCPAQAQNTTQITNTSSSLTLPTYVRNVVVLDIADTADRRHAVQQHGAQFTTG